jgi:hypothetical protein
MRHARKILRCLPFALLILFSFLWLKRASLHPRAVLWFDRYWLFAGADTGHLRIVANRDTSDYPMRRPIPYVRLWRDAPETRYAGDPSGYFEYLMWGVYGEYFGKIAPTHKLLGIAVGHGSPALGRIVGTGDLDDHWVIDLPWWLLLSVPGIVLLWQVVGLAKRRKDKRFTPGHCPQCGYDLRASHGRCPECGSQREAVRQSRSWHSGLPRLGQRIAMAARAQAAPCLMTGSVLAVALAVHFRPVRPLVNLVPPASTTKLAADAFYPAVYNVIDLRSRTGLPSAFVKAINDTVDESHRRMAEDPLVHSKLIRIIADSSDRLGASDSLVHVHLTAQDHARIAKIINQWRGGSRE